MCNIFNTFALFMFAKLRRIIQLSKYYIINFILFIIISLGLINIATLEAIHSAHSLGIMRATLLPCEENFIYFFVHNLIFT